MAYRLKLNEPTTKGVRRIAGEQLEQAIGALAADESLATAAHGVRKNLKRTRALLRLVRPGLDPDVYHRENTALREAGQLLSDLRDSVVLEATWHQLAGAKRQLAGSALAARVAAAIATSREQAAKPGANGEHRGERARETLVASRKRLKRLQLEPATFATVADGLERSYRKCQHGFVAAYRSPDDHAFHEWRKTVQHHWRHMALVSQAWPDYCAARVRAAREISEMIGRDHDLAVLVERLRRTEDIDLTPDDIARIEAQCWAGQAQLRAAVLPRATRLLAERPGGLRRRIAVYWDTAEQSEGLPAPALRARSGAQRDATRAR